MRNGSKIASGDSPKNSNWYELLQIIEKDYPSENNEIISSIEGYFKGINSGLNINVLPNFINATNKTKLDTFNYLQVELLLEQAAGLLERGMRDRSEYDQYSAKDLEVALDIKEYDALVLLHEKEKQAGFYTWLADQALAEAEAAKLLANSAKDTELALQSILKYINDNRNNIVEQVRKAAFVSVMPYFYYDLPSNQDVDIKPSGKTTTKDDTPLDIFYPEGTRRVINKRTTTVSASVDQANFNLDIQTKQLEAEIINAKASAASGEERKKAANIRAEWENKDKIFKEERRNLALALQAIRKEAGSAEDGSLNYKQKMFPLAERYKRDFNDAIERIIVAQRGVTLLYGYDEPLPTSPPGSQPKRKFFDDCLLWVRDAISFISKFVSYEQHYIQAVSLKKIIGNEKWKQGLGVLKWKVAISEEYFKTIYKQDQYHVRLRGISAYVSHNDMREAWHLGIKIPTSSYCTHYSGKREELSQEHVPICRIGRASSRDSLRHPDVVGVSSLFNSSPFGEWEISLSETSVTGIPSSQLEDIQLDLHIAFIPGISAS